MVNSKDKAGAAAICGRGIAQICKKFLRTENKKVSKRKKIHIKNVSLRTITQYRV